MRTYVRIRGHRHLACTSARGPVPPVDTSPPSAPRRGGPNGESERDRPHLSSSVPVLSWCRLKQHGARVKNGVRDSEARRAPSCIPARGNRGPVPLGRLERGERRVRATGRRTLNIPSAPLDEPPPAHEVVEHDGVAPVAKHQLEVAAAQGLARPPAVLHHPVLEHAIDGGAPEGRWHAVLTDAHRRGAGSRQPPGRARGQRRLPSGRVSTKGASTARRSGSRDSGSTSSTLSAAASPAAWRA